MSLLSFEDIIPQISAFIRRPAGTAKPISRGNGQPARSALTSVRLQGDEPATLFGTYREWCGHSPWGQPWQPCAQLPGIETSSPVQQ